MTYCPHDVGSLRGELEKLNLRLNRLTHRVSTDETRRQARSLKKQIRDLSGRIAHLESRR